MTAHGRHHSAPAEATRIAGYPAALTPLALPRGPLALYTVSGLESLVDRGAVLRGEVEPPYWAYLWTGARCLAHYVERALDVRGRRVLEIGCGLGLCGLAAARAGAAVTLVDLAAPAIAFVRASAAAAGLVCEAVRADFLALPPTWRFDVVLAAEVAYDPPTFGGLADALQRHLAPGGVALVADAFRTDTRALYRAFTARGLASHALDFGPYEEGKVSALRLAAVMPLGRPAP